MGSAELRGTWTDLFRNHLTQEDDGTFSPNLEDLHVRPQVPLVITDLVALLVHVHIGRLIDDESAVHYFGSRFDDLHKRARNLGNFHEEYLSKGDA
jgi:hypothetical protein